MVLQSLNPRWNQDEFHARVAALASIGEGSKVLDLGCGRGLTLSRLLATAGASGEVFAADRSRKNLEAVKQSYPAEIADKRLVVVETDVSAGLPFASSSLDTVVCQNVMECIVDKAGLLVEIRRVLKSGGVAVIGHYDFDGVMLASDDRELTRRLVHGYADYVQHWQDVAEGQMGRLLPGLAANSPFSEVVTETVLFVDLTLSNESYAQTHLEGMVALSEEFGVLSERARDWLGDLQGRSESGTFYYALPWTYFVARVT